MRRLSLSSPWGSAQSPYHLLSGCPATEEAHERNVSQKAVAFQRKKKIGLTGETDKVMQRSSGVTFGEKLLLEQKPRAGMQQKSLV